MKADLARLRAHFAATPRAKTIKQLADYERGAW
jgi:hypothetical protein